MRAINQPVSWWGWHWEPPTPMSIIELIEAGNLDARLAAMLWIAMERGASLIVAADPPNSGKTTTLSALLSFTPPETAVYFTRGMGEPFALPPVSPAYDTYILVNEMSDHIPVYTWDDNARRVFQLLAQGYRLGTTMHADTTAGVIEQLEGDLRIPPAHIGKLTFIMPLHIGRRAPVIRRVLEVAFLEATGAGYKTHSFATWDEGTDTFAVLAGDEERALFAEWAAVTPPDLETQLDQREGFLRNLTKTGVRAIPEVNAAVQAYWEQVAKPD